MAKDLLDELRWRGMLQDHTPGVEEVLAKGPVSGYVGFDPTADSLHVGNLVPIMLLVHFQECGHKPVALVGGATGMVGDPSGKIQERQLLDEVDLAHNVAAIRTQLEHFLDLDPKTGVARLVNNLDWFKEMRFLDFIRDVGKHISVGYMLAKDSVKNRMETGISFTEFTYQLVQGYDMYWLHANAGVRLQLGGSDQWGNITTGIELVRRIAGEEVHGITTPLLTKADGTKFGKSEGGNIWLDPKRTSPYKFYQFWLNASDEEAARAVRIFTTWERAKVEDLLEQHAVAPHKRLVQKSVAADITERVHGKAELEKAIAASEGLFSLKGQEDMRALHPEVWEVICDEAPHVELLRPALEAGVEVVPFLTEISGFLPSASEARRALKEGSVSISGVTATDTTMVTVKDMIHDRYILLRRGKKNFFVVRVGS